MSDEPYFNGSGTWVLSEWDVAYTSLPSAVLSTLKERYSDYSIDRDDIEVQEYPSGLRYVIEMERGERDLKAYISSDGTVIGEKFED